MDCSTADEPANVVPDSPGKDSSSSDDKPLKKLVANSRVLDDSSDDEPLIKMKSTQAKKAVKKDNASLRSNGTNNKKAESLNSNDGPDYAALSKLAVKLHSRLMGKAPVVSSGKTTPVKSKRNAARKKVKYAESSSSDDETLAAMKSRLTKAPKEQKTSANSRKTKAKRKDKSVKDPSASDNSSDDDMPLVNLIAKKKKPVKKNTKLTSESKSRATKKRGDLHESSDDEPLIELVKKKRKQTDKQTETKTTASAPEKRDRAAKKPRKTPVSGSSNTSSDDEPLIKAAKHPQVTKILRIILDRCDCEGAEATRSLEKMSTDTPTAEKTAS